MASPFQKVIINGSMNVSISSNPIVANYWGVLSVQAVWTGTPEGTLSLAVSNELNGTYDPLLGSSVDVGGAAGSWTWDLGPMAPPFIKVIYMPASGSGILNVSTFIR